MQSDLKWSKGKLDIATRNAIISIVVIVLIAISLAVVCVREFTDFTLPSILFWGSQHIAGRFVTDDVKPKATLSGFKRQELQNSLETVFNDCVSLKVTVFKDDACLYYCVIELSNVLSGWDRYFA